MTRLARWAGIAALAFVAGVGAGDLLAMALDRRHRARRPRT